MLKPKYLIKNKTFPINILYSIQYAMSEILMHHLRISLFIALDRNHIY